MLARAGWRGGGLGAEEQGITSPLPAWHNQGRRGIGAAPSKQQQQAGPAGKAGALRISYGQITCDPRSLHVAACMVSFKALHVAACMVSF